MSEFTIKRLGHQGDGIADGPVYAPLTLPTEVVTGTLDQQILRDVRIITPSSDRVRAACRHYKSCGGCSLMHASDPFVADWKVDVVKNCAGRTWVGNRIASLPDIPCAIAPPCHIFSTAHEKGRVSRISCTWIGCDHRKPRLSVA